MFAEDLRRARDGYPVSAVGGGLGYRLRRWAGRNRRSLRALAIAAGAAAVAAGTAGADRLLTRAQERREAADGLAAATAAAERADGPQEALSELRAWLELPESAPLAWEGWLAVADRARAARDGDAELDALARAWVAARDGAQEAEVLARAVNALLQRWSFRAALAAGKPAHDRLPVDTRATLRLLAGDMAGALQWMAPDDPRAPLARALSRATQTLAPGAVFTTTAGPDGPLFALDRAQRTVVELSRRVDLAPTRSWPLGALEPAWPRTHLIALDARYLVAEQQGLPGWLVGVRLDDHGVTPVGSWPEARVQRVAVDRSGVRPTVLLGTGPYDRHLVELDPDGWQRAAPSPDADVLQSDIMDVVVTQLDDDSAEEVLLGYGPWWAFGVARLDRGEDGVLRRTAFAALGFVHDVAVIRTPLGPRVVALKSDRYAAPELFGAAQPFGPAPAGVHLLHPEDLSEDRVLSLEGPPGAESTVGYVYVQVGDIDGDGLEDLAVWVDRDNPGYGWFNRQLPDGSFAGFLVAAQIPVVLSDLDGDGDAEVIVREAGTDKPSWVLGAGDGTPPISDPPPAADEPPPAGLRSDGARAAWRDAEVLRELGLARMAAPALLRAAADAPPSDAALLSLRAGALAEAAADLPTALAAFRRVAPGEDPAGALGLHRVARSVVDLDAASLAATRLAQTDPSWLAEVDRLAALRAEPPVVWRAGEGGLPDTVWRFPSPAAVHRTASGAFDAALLGGQSAVLVLPLEGDGRRVGVTARFEIAELDPGVELEFGILGVGGDLLSVQLGRHGRSGVIVARCRAVGIDEVGVFPSETIGDGMVEIELARVADGVSCRLSAGGVSRLYRSASPAVDLTPVAFVVHDRAAGDYGLPKSTMARVLVHEVTVLGARVAASVPDPGVWELVTGGAPAACYRPDVCLVSALRRGGGAPAAVDAVLREPAGMETLHLLARTGTPSELERLRAAMSPDAFADLITAAWAGTLTHAPADLVLERLDQPWLTSVRPDSTQRILLLAHVASALAEVGRTSRAVAMYEALTAAEVLARVSALTRLNLLEGRARVELSMGRVEDARATIARAVAATPVPDAVRRRLSADPLLVTLLPP